SSSPGSAQEIFLKGWHLEVPLVQGLDLVRRLLAFQEQR
ncbi:hypothetical protein AVEN_247185-1, partial [Araneus ventricosus]